MAQVSGIEPATCRLTADRSTEDVPYALKYIILNTKIPRKLLGVRFRV
ncbi:hypothetical protein NEF87_002674 [Candidatus Lokiarchaeum ossiferum]|uniref:Uncharacterized protein n=1 Tax=Candidatus Lokiarchaeum ossiferum TaxID=2951803 RepID=A0ABY6HS97_9ARCH|nr:hypothetical protein NEF87_002674 [Candidatus Lokiarchaeum sp. B-35]